MTLRIAMQAGEQMKSYYTQANYTDSSILKKKQSYRIHPIVNLLLYSILQFTTDHPKSTLRKTSKKEVKNKLKCNHSFEVCNISLKQSV